MTYEYKCDQCGKLLEIRATIAEKERGLKFKCPDCGSTKATQVFTTVNVFTGSGGGDVPPGCCGPGPGTGCCG